MTNTERIQANNTELREAITIANSLPEAGGGDNVTKSIVEKTITIYSDNEVTKIGDYVFYNCNELTSVNIPSVTSISLYAFNACELLSAIKGNAITSVGNYSFGGCSALNSIDFPKLTTVGTYAFQNCTSLTEFNGEKVTSVGTYAFTGCSALAEISLPQATSIGGYAFNGVPAKHLSLPSLKSMTTGAFRGSRFETVDCPIVTNIANNGFRAQGYIKSVTFPSVTLTSSEAMRNCTALAYVDLPVCTSFGTYTFYDCSSLETLILRTTSKVCSMGNVNVLTNTKIAAGTGYIYVPTSMVDKYKSATNWSTFAGQIRAIEDYPEITGG